MSIKGDDLSVRGIDHGKIPDQHVNTKLAVAAHKVVEKISERGTALVGRIEPNAAIELPA
jgi:hypothetical protein